MIFTQGEEQRAKRLSTELSRSLFGDEGSVHEHWRHVVAGEAFAYRDGLDRQERIDLAYRRLNLVNASVDDPWELAGDVHRLAALHEWAAMVDGGLTTVAGIHYNLFMGSLLDHDADPRRDLAPLAAMERLGTFLCTESDHGNDAAQLETTATFDRSSGGFVLHTPHPGARKFMPNTSLAGGAKSAVVAARLLSGGQDLGVFLFLVELSDAAGFRPGIRVQQLDERTGSPVDHCLTTFDHVELPASALLQGAHGRLAADGTLTSGVGNRRKRFLRSIGRVTAGKLCMSACGVGAVRAALTIAVCYAHQRHVAGMTAGRRVPLAAFRSHQDRLLKATAHAYAMTFLHRAATRAWARHEPHEREDVERLVAVTKAWNTWQGRQILIECRERCGAQGLFPANGLADFPVDIEGAITAEGDNLVIWVKAAGELLFAPADTPPRTASGRALGDVRALRDLFAAHEARSRSQASAALRAGPAGDPLARFNRAVGPAQEAVDAHAVVRAADAFLDAIAAADAEAAPLLSDLCRLFLLEKLRPVSGDLLAADLLTVEEVRFLPGAVDDLCVRLTPQLGLLVEAFAVPEELLRRLPLLDPTADLPVTAPAPM
ncbi:acyl-CoA dehydrogenase family protein [Streptomyces sp. SP18CS02]|uniref:acyl-CoA dehydrogenase family protein n=1 Tax=Streptomyces sp. SP18CS02 TaxID=3002531 RepID=UPI002E78FAF8|nr:acyl-CoA dehydrogenase [Streptomyces sp. SP18CS02]MEE1752820.1 acyl-CoA dehydrogenase [Streptomyces sp. SP18CS02]